MMGITLCFLKQSNSQNNGDALATLVSKQVQWAGITMLLSSITSLFIGGGGGVISLERITKYCN